MFRGDYQGKIDIRWMWTKDGRIISDQTNLGFAKTDFCDWFRGGQVTIDKAGSASTAEEADRILSEAYIGDDEQAVGVHWEIDFYVPGRLS